MATRMNNRHYQERERQLERIEDFAIRQFRLQTQEFVKTLPVTKMDVREYFQKRDDFYSHKIAWLKVFLNEMRLPSDAKYHRRRLLKPSTWLRRSGWYLP